MKTITFIKRFASVLLVIALLLPAFASAQSVKSNDFLKKSKSEQARLRQGVKINPKMAQMRRAVKNPQAIPSSTNLTRQAPAGNAYRAPLAVTESGATLYGNLIYNYNMYDLSQVGFYSINPNTGEYDPVGINSMLAGAGTVVDGIAYVSYADMYYGNILSLYTIIYDVEEGEIIEAVEHSPSDFGSYATNMAYNYVEDAIYAVTYDETGTEYILSKFDRDTKTYIKITDLIVPNDLFAMAFDPEGNLYIIGDDGIVRTLDITTGRTIDVICETGFMPAYMQSACWSPKDKKIIWAASNDYNSYLIAIDVTAGTSETICSFDMYEEWTCLYTTDQIADEDAPAAPAITYTINTPGSTGGSITIQSPTQNIIGETLSSAEYTLVIELNGEEIFSESITPGEEITKIAEFVEGKNTIRAYAINDAGKGAIATKKLYAGNDTPLAVTNLEASIDDDGLATLTWTAPTGGENDGYIDFSAVTYNIQRSGETVATGITNTTYKDQLPDEMAQYEWSVYAVFDNKISKPASTGKMIYGDAFTLPYEHAFDNSECLNLYTIVNANDDNRTWVYDDSKKALIYIYNSKNDADDYAFTPPLQLNNGKAILVEVNAHSQSTDYPEILEVILVSSADPNDKKVIIPPTQLDWTEPQTLSTYITVDEPGKYHIGLHAVSLSNMYYLLVKDIKVTEDSNQDAPKAVQNATATPGDNGALTTTLTFTTPTESLDGKTLTEDVTITAYRDNEVIGTTICAPGATGSIVDNNAQDGFNKYVLVTSNSTGKGLSCEVSCRCGFDIPATVENIKFTTDEDNLSSIISWDAPTTGQEGGFVNPSEIVYTIYVPKADGNDVEAIDETTDLFYEFTAEEQTLQAYTFYVSAKNDLGESTLSGGSVVLGEPYPLPFVEEIIGTTLVNSPWLLYNENPNSYASWGLGSDMENYNLPEHVIAPDGGMIACYDFYEVTGGSCGLQVPKIALADAKAPTLYFSMYHYTTADDINELTISATTDDASFKEIFAKRVNDVESNGWVEYQVKLDEYKGASWIGLMINANIATDGFVFLDYVTVEDTPENDVMVKSFEIPTKVKIGEEVEFAANIFNKGYKAASYNVSFFVNDKVIATIDETALESNAEKTYTTNFTPATEYLGEATAKVVITMTDASDENESNNEATVKMRIAQPHLRVVTDLAGTMENGVVSLTWSAPTIAPEPIVDDIEEYESFIVDNIGDYTTVDVDNTETYGIDEIDFQLANGPKAWQVWCPKEIGITTDTWQAYKSDKCLVAFSTITGAANDWLISPEILGGTEFSFRAAIPTNQYGTETFEVLYSTTGTDINSFQLLSQESKSTVEWEQFSYDLPADAKHFAIRYTSTDIFALLIDDISYTDPSSSSELTIVGYNVYLDGEKVNNAVLTETTYAYNGFIGCSGIRSFNVTVVYNEGESLFSNTFLYDDGASIDNLNDMGVNVYGQDGFIKIENASGRMLNIYNVDGKTIYNAIATDNEIYIPAKLGVYVVNIDSKTSCKVIVR